MRTWFTAWAFAVTREPHRCGYAARTEQMFHRASFSSMRRCIDGERTVLSPVTNPVQYTSLGYPRYSALSWGRSQRSDSRRSTGNRDGDFGRPGGSFHRVEWARSLTN